MPRNVRTILESTFNSWPILKKQVLRLYDSRIIHFYWVGGTAACLHILFSWLFTSFVFGLSRYYIGYFIGMGISWFFNFVMHTLVTFKAKGHFGKRLAGFLTYSVVSNFIQAWAVTTLTSLFGNEYYLLIITTVIVTISIGTFFVYKLWLFARVEKEAP